MVVYNVLVNKRTAENAISPAGGLNPYDGVIPLSGVGRPPVYFHLLESIRKYIYVQQMQRIVQKVVDKISQKNIKKVSRNKKTTTKSKRKWTVKDTKFLYPTLTEEEAKMAWEAGW